MDKIKKQLNGIVLPLAPVKPSPFWFGYDLGQGVITGGIIDFRGVQRAQHLVNNGVLYGQDRLVSSRN